MSSPALGILRAAVLALTLLAIDLDLQPVRASPQQPPNRIPAMAQRTVEFAGTTWAVRSGFGNPGPSNWSDSSSSVWTDEQGRLHLKLHRIDGVWHAAEVWTYGFAYYGPHRFYVVKENPTLDQIDPNVVLGLFLFKQNCGPRCEAELDVEFSRWGDPASAHNAQYVAAPGTEPGNKYTFSLSLTNPLTTHIIDWQKNRVIFASFLGEDLQNPANLLQYWTYNGPYIPREHDNMVVVLDLWMEMGMPPADGQEVEVIIADAGLSTVCLPVAQLVCGETVQGSTAGSGARDQVEGYPISSWPETGPETAYAFTAPSDGPVTLQFTQNPAGLDLFVLNGAGGACSSTQAIAFGNETAAFNAVAGQTYYFLIDGFQESGGDYGLQIDCSGALPPPDPVKVALMYRFPTIFR